MRSKALIFALLLLAAPVALAQAQPTNDAPEAADTQPPATNNVSTDDGNVFGGILQRISDAAESLASSASEATDAVATGVGGFFRGIGTAGVALAGGLGAAAGALASGLGTAFAAVGQGLTSAIAAIGVAAGTAVAFLAKAYGGLIAALRPDAMAPGAYLGMTAGAAAVSTGAASWAGWQVLRKWGMVGGGFLPIIGGFSRIDDDQLLEHPVRQQIFSTIQQHPGIHASQLAREVGVGWGTVSHHLDKLNKAKIVTTRKVNNQKCFFEQGGVISRQDMEAASAVKGDTAGAIARFVHANPMTSQKDMAEVLEISPALASFHVKKLYNLGVLDKLRHGKETLLTTSSAMQRLLAADADVAAAMEQRDDEALQYSA